MASDSRVSGSEDARTPKKNTRSNGAPDLDPNASPNPEPSPNTSAQPISDDAGPVADQAASGDAGAEGTIGNSVGGNGTVGNSDGQPSAPQGEPKGTKKRSGKANKLAGKKRADAPEKEDRKTRQPEVSADAAVATGAAFDAGQPDDGPSRDGQPAAEQEERESFFARFGGNRFLLFNAVPSWMVSMMIHAVLLMILALMTLPQPPEGQQIVAVADPNRVEEVENLENEEIDPLDVDVFEGQMPAESSDIRTTTAELDVPSLDDVSAAPEQIKLEDFGDMAAPSDALMDSIGGGIGEGLGEARGAKARRGLVAKNGGSKGSEAAVAAALKWLAEHQLRDGGWNFDHTTGACKGRCTHPGEIPSARNGATAMALLPFLGAGQTHMEGNYQQTVERGLAYLVRSMKLGNGMGELSDSGGRLYSHGLASIALCEAYAMTNDSGLLQPAQLSLNFIVYAQDPIGGGWRYMPHQEGDTSVLGWQLMACKSGHMAYLKVPRKTLMGASKFLDFVQEDNGARYGYTKPAQGPATTAVGLLCRMYLGWKHDNPSLKAGVEYLNKTGPTQNMYYNYYATQVMRHYGGEFWDAWNSRMRDRLVKSQDTKGHAKGSWYFPRGAYSDRGGRLYCTSMATMILEVYYRHLPLYGKQASEEEFPL